eukprot:CAMPEP_0194514882 /NCGR_PEP_ID=MMETSP0253-20130528/47436_1 /TAXON_ID=2966 /ORGANISM="Noctiluca scintillans" /LENGTH=110 /DNA_ID=CAMNT_0039358583 /DNA_START=407 /DNA_END=739 /DNA_ORIENTATION=+
MAGAVGVYLALQCEKPPLHIFATHPLLLQRDLEVPHLLVLCVKKFSQLLHTPLKIRRCGELVAQVLQGLDRSDLSGIVAMIPNLVPVHLCLCTCIALFRNDLGNAKRALH